MGFCFVACVAKASATSVVRMSKAAASQYGGSANCPVTNKLSKTAEKRGDDACHRVFLDWVSLLFLLSLLQLELCRIMTARFQENDLSLNVPISWVPLATAEEDDQLFPILKPSDFVNYLCQSGNVEKLFGEEPLETIQPALLEFWSRFAKEVPDHQIFSANQAGEVSLSRSVPIMVHGDEGRNFKRKGIMLLSFEGVLGKGARPFADKNPEKTKKLTMGVNIGGHSFCSRFLCAAMQRKCYNQNPEAKCAFYSLLFATFPQGFYAATMFDLSLSCFGRARYQENLVSLTRHLAEDFLHLQCGFQYRGERWHLIVIGVKGDMPFLAKTGNFVRHWLRAPRKEKQDRSKPLPGICWLCLGGTEDGGPWEDCNWNCQWSMVPNKVPWECPPPWLHLFHSPTFPETMFRPDLFHNYHGGLGMYFISSAIVECMCLVEGSLDVKVQHFAEQLREWASLKGNRMPHSGHFCKERIGLTSMQVLPDANWSKFDDTRVYHSFLLWWLEKRANECEGNQVLISILDALRVIDRFFHILYTSGLWLESTKASVTGLLGRQFVKLYCELAHICYNDRRLRFPMVVKLHMFDHSSRKLLALAAKNKWILSPLADTVQMNEDFVGQCARLSRRVSPVTNSLRTLQRYLTRARRIWAKSCESKGYAAAFKPISKKRQASSDR